MFDSVTNRIVINYVGTKSADNIFEINGHKLQAIDKIISKCLKNNSFNIIIANTVKGYGIKSMESNPEWHHKSPSLDELKSFKLELNL